MASVDSTGNGAVVNLSLIGVAAFDASGDCSDILASGDIYVDQGEIPDFGTFADGSEYSLVGSAADRQIADGVSVAFEDSGVGIGVVAQGCPVAAVLGRYFERDVCCEDTVG